MGVRRISLIKVIQVIVALLMTFTSCAYSEQRRYSNEWVARIQGGVLAAQRLADSVGYSYAGQIPGFPDTYLLVKPDQPRHHKRAFPMLTKRLTNDHRVEWAEQQFYKLRQKRDFGDDETPSTARRNTSTAEGRAPWWQEGVPRRRRRRDVDPPSPSLFNDELWDKQWYMQDTRTRPDLPPLDLQVLPVYARGYTGKGVRVTVLDDGVEHTHEDLRDNYDPAISFDVDDGDPDPMPRYEPLRRNAHGTRCAGEIAMKANNVKCGVGVAFNARIGGVRLLDADVNDRMEGTALGWARDLVDIYSASWGPNDDGATVEGPGRLAQEALRKGVTEHAHEIRGLNKQTNTTHDPPVGLVKKLCRNTYSPPFEVPLPWAPEARKGRGGRGSIYIWASGNGGTFGDNCNCDGYVNSIYTLAVGSASERGHFPWYGERCASTMAAAYSSGAYRDQMIATTDLRNTCTVRHTGTSAAAPLAAGIIALALEANPELTWRDMQHLVAVSAEATPLADNHGWRKNAAGFWANTRFGFGLLNADRLVRAAEKWLPVPQKTECKCNATPKTNTTFLRGERITIEFECDACAGTPQEVNYLEHVQVLSNIQYPMRGALEIYLTSPGGTKVQLLSPRKNDKSDRGFVDWTFMSVLTWGEVPRGRWLIEIIDKSTGPARLGVVGDFQLTFHGTAQLPAYRLELNTTNLPSRPVYGNKPVMIHDLDNHIDTTNNHNLVLEQVPDPDVDLAEPVLPDKGSPLVKLLNTLTRAVARGLEQI